MNGKDNNMSTTAKSADRMEIAMKKTIELMECLMKSDANPEKVRFAAASLAKEREVIMEWDENRSDPIRDVLYGLSESIEYVMEWYVNREEKLKNMKEIKKEEVFDCEKDGTDMNTVSQEGKNGKTMMNDDGGEKTIEAKMADSETNSSSNLNTTRRSPMKIPKEEKSSDDLPLCEVSDCEENEGILSSTGTKKLSDNSNAFPPKKRHRVKEECEDENDPMEEKEMKRLQQNKPSGCNPNKMTDKKNVGLSKKYIGGPLDKYIRRPQADKEKQLGQ